MSKETFTFQTEVSRLLDIVAGSLYSNREIFLRELISNASDACDKLRHQALTSPSLIEGDHDFKVALSVDKKAKTITVSDNGIGMNHDDLLATLGTIASSGTGAFIEQMGKDDKKDMGLIGQFGVGFYSAFMVCDKVEVTTRKAGEKESWLWVSDGKGEFSIDSAERDERGTTVVLHLKKDAKEFLDPSRITHIVKMYSDHIGFPVTLMGDKADGDDEAKEETLNAASAIWTRAPQDVNAEQYKEFYHHTAHAFDDPWITLHNRIEGVVSYTNLLFIPSMRPFDLFDPDRKSHVKLFVNRVFITEQADGLLPPYLRFLRGVVDSEDLSLNISREMLQNDPKLNKIRSGLVKKVLAALKKKADKAPEDYATFWDNFGIVLKEGLVDDFPMRDKLLELTRFKSTGEGATSLAGYVERMKEGQEAIYYITGEDEAQVGSSPHLEGFKAKGIEVLLLVDPVDEFWMQHITEFDGKAFKSITRGEANLDAIKNDDAKDETKDDKDDDALQLDLLIAAIKLELGDSVKDVRPSKRLTESPVCLIADEGDMDVNMERLLRRHGQMQNGLPRVLEINPSHAIVKKLSERAGNDAEDGLLKDAAHLLLDQARIAEGEAPADAAAFARRLASVLERAL